ncbi:MAG: exodeoxyribonuclease VII large subunit [Phycisphaerae bacterium]|nr:exodeoxyribonuclease VII large subunit [Phycisphaerae bacterium]
MAQIEFNFGNSSPDDRPPEKPDAVRKATGRKPAVAKPAKPKPPQKQKAVETVYTVSSLNRLIKFALSDHLPGKIVLTGEISNCKLHGSGHLYLTLKDEDSNIAAVMWRSGANKLKFRPADGMGVVATGHVDVYEPQGKYQFYISKLEPSGVGALELAFRQMAETLRAEGLFDQEHKKRLPAFPMRIAIVTSGTGAAIRDISQTLTRRFPVAQQLLYPVAVQGENAKVEIVAAIQDINRRRDELGGIDVMIVGRGGGSLEDLWAFNEEMVARAIFASAIPIISAVGHEVDTTIADMVADVRAATPTAAAELAVPVLMELVEDLQQSQLRLYHSIKRRIDHATASLGGLASRGLFTRPLDAINHRRQRLDEKVAMLSHGIHLTVRNAERALESHTGIIRRIEPHTALANARGRLNERQLMLRATFRAKAQQCRNELAQLVTRHRACNLQESIGHHQTMLNRQAERLSRAERQLRNNFRGELESLAKRLENLDPRAVLQRGYSITRMKDSGEILTADRLVKRGDVVVTEMAGEVVIESEITETPRRKANGD